MCGVSLGEWVVQGQSRMLVACGKVEGDVAGMWRDSAHSQQAQGRDQ